MQVRTQKAPLLNVRNHNKLVNIVKNAKVLNILHMHSNIVLSSGQYLTQNKLYTEECNLNYKHEYAPPSVAYLRGWNIINNNNNNNNNAILEQSQNEKRQSVVVRLLCISK